MIKPWDNASAWSIRLIQIFYAYPPLDNAIEERLVYVLSAVSNTYKPKEFVSKDYLNPERGFVNFDRGGSGTYLKIFGWQPDTQWRDIQEAPQILMTLLRTPSWQGGPGRERFEFAIIRDDKVMAKGKMGMGLLGEDAEDGEELQSSLDADRSVASY